MENDGGVDDCDRGIDSDVDAGVGQLGGLV